MQFHTIQADEAERLIAFGKTVGEVFPPTQSMVITLDEVRAQIVLKYLGE